ncbi:MAG: hypothetical protein IPO21_10320 [Bacteroidales bacterium]|nr:hypothetical protein [Bacteroidales bacterium]
MTKNILFFFSFLSFYIAGSAQENDTAQIVIYDTVYVVKDTIVNTVELVKYTYKDVPPTNFYFGAGIAYCFTSITSSTFEKKLNTLSIPLSLRFTHGNFFTQSGFISNSAKFDTYITDSILKITNTQTTAKEVFDTIYKYNNGNPIMVFVTKDVVKSHTDTSYTDTIITTKHKYSSFQIPLLIGYSYTKKYGRGRKKKSLIASISTGLGYNYFYTDAQNVIEKEFPTQNSYYFTYIVNASGGFQFYKRFVLECSFFADWTLGSNALDINRKGIRLKLFYKIF